MAPRYDGQARLRKRKYRVDESGDEWTLHRGEPTLEVIDGGGSDPRQIPGKRLKVVQDGVSIQMEHQEGKGNEVVYRNGAGKVLRRIAVAEIDENGHIHANHKEKIEIANAEYGINQDRTRFFGEPTKPKTPNDDAMKKGELALERKRFGIHHFEHEVLAKRSFFARIGDFFTFNRGRAILKREKREYNEMLQTAGDYFTISSNEHTREIECKHNHDGERTFTKEVEEHKRRNLAQEKPSEEVMKPYERQKAA